MTDKVDVRQGPSRSHGSFRAFVDFTWPILAAVVAALALRAFVVEPFCVPTGSMLNTIQLDETIVVEKVSYLLHGPQQGDVATFVNPADASETLVKRVIATEGQTVDLVDGRVLVDGVALDEPYTEGRPSYPLDTQLPSVGPISYPYEVPEGHVWMMGDNRTNSRDSRYFGAVPVNSISGHAMFVIWPMSDAHWL